MNWANFIHVADVDDFKLIFWGIVIAIFLISKFISSKKKFDESAPQQGKPPPSGGDPAEELRKFLEGLGQTQEQPPKTHPAPVAPPPPVHPRRVAAPRVKAHAVAPPPPVEEPVRRVVAVPVPEETTPDEAAVLARYRAQMVATAVPVRASTKWRAILTTELRAPDRQPIRKGLIMREIFGAPTALRRREVVYPLV